MSFVKEDDPVGCRRDRPMSGDQIAALLPFVDMTRGISGTCDRAIQGKRPHSDHGWCANRNRRECQCDCPCHWTPERVAAAGSRVPDERKD